MALKILLHSQGGFVLVEGALVALRAKGKAGRKDEARLRAAISAWGDHGFVAGLGLDFKPIEGKPYEKKMWEARYLKTARSDGTHGYRIFYMVTRMPSGEEAAILLGLWAKSGDHTPSEVLKEAWAVAEEVRQLIEKDRDKYFKQFCP